MSGGVTRLPLFICWELMEWWSCPFCELFWGWGWGLLWLFIISSKLMKSDFVYAVKLVPCSVKTVCSLCCCGGCGTWWFEGPKSIILPTATLGGDEVFGSDWTAGLVSRSNSSKFYYLLTCGFGVIAILGLYFSSFLTKFYFWGVLSFFSSSPHLVSSPFPIKLCGAILGRARRHLSSFGTTFSFFLFNLKGTFWRERRQTWWWWCWVTPQWTRVGFEGVLVPCTSK